VSVFDAQRAFQHDRDFLELRPLPGLFPAAGEIIRATLTAACPEFTRPANSWICFGFVPTQSITVGFSISFGMVVLAD
jgi:hypothetical protein